MPGGRGPGGRGEDERTMFTEELIAMLNQRVYTGGNRREQRCAFVPGESTMKGWSPSRGACERDLDAPAFELISWHYILIPRENGAAHYEDLLSRLLAATPVQCGTYGY